MKGKRVLISAVLLLTLTSCLSHIPVQGPVNYGAEAYAPSSQNFVRTLVSAPTIGSTPQSLIRQFLAAIAGDQGDYATSRLYLAPEVRFGWRPEKGVRIYTDRLQSSFSRGLREANTFAFSGSEAGTIDEQGHYQRAAPGTLLFENFSVRRVGGEWRIASLVDGLALSESDVARAYRQSNIYFLNASKRTLVPDSVYLPVNLGVSTSLIRALLSGPTAWLSPAVTTAIPVGASLAVGSVPIQQGVATVDLSAPVGNISSLDRQAMSAQIVWTLKQLAEVAAVRITIGRAPLIVAGSGEAQSRFAYSNFSPDVLTGETQSFVMADRGLFRISDLASKPVIKLVNSEANHIIAQFSAAAISLDGGAIAGINSANSLIAGPLSGPLVLQVSAIADSNWLAPSWDSDGVLWAARRHAGLSQVYAVAPGAKALAVSAEVIANRWLQGFRIARDGTRVALAIESGNSSRLFVARVIRSASGPKIGFRIEAPIELPWTGGSISLINWADATHLAILTSVTPTSIWRVAIDASEEINLAGIVDPNVLAAAPGMPVLAADSRGTLSALVGQEWLEIGNGRYPMYPG